MIGGLGTPELIIVLFIILLLFGGKKLPELARSLGTAVKEYTSAAEDSSTYIKEKTKTKNDDEEKEAILEAARKLGIETEGRNIKDIAEDLVKTTEK